MITGVATMTGSFGGAGGGPCTRWPAQPVRSAIERAAALLLEQVTRDGRPCGRRRPSFGLLGSERRIVIVSIEVVERFGHPPLPVFLQAAGRGLVDRFGE